KGAVRAHRATGNSSWHGKPHSEQDQTGTRWCGPHWGRVGCYRQSVKAVAEEWLCSTEPGFQASSHFFLPDDLCRQRKVFSTSCLSLSCMSIRLLLMKVLS